MNFLRSPCHGGDRIPAAACHATTEEGSAAAVATHGRKVGRFYAIRMSDLANEPPAPERVARVGFLGTQPPALLDSMTAVMLIGRRDCAAADFEDVFAGMDELWHPSEATTSCLAGERPLDRFLQDRVKELTAARGGTWTNGPRAGGCPASVDKGRAGKRVRGNARSRPPGFCWKKRPDVGGVWRAFPVSAIRHTRQFRPFDRGWPIG